MKLSPVTHPETSPVIMSMPLNVKPFGPSIRQPGRYGFILFRVFRVSRVFRGPYFQSLNLGLDK
jgi:hypothetical protein